MPDPVTIPTAASVQRTSPVFREAKDGKPRTYFVPGSVLTHVLAHGPTDDAERDNRPATVTVQRIDDRVREVRANVRDAAAAVLAWLAVVVEHDQGTDLDDVLRRCLRPSGDPADVNYAAMADDIERVTGVALSAKRVQTAVRHLRKAADERAESESRLKPDADSSTNRDEERGSPSADAVLRDALVSLRQRLADHFATLSSQAADPKRDADTRALGVDLLAAVRSAASRVIDRGFAEHLNPSVDLPGLEGRFLDHVRALVRPAADFESSQHNANLPDSLHRDFRQLLLTLADHPGFHGNAAGSAEHDVKLVMHGAKVVAALMGPDSLPGVLAHLNVLVVGRALIGTDLYVAEMLRLADAAERLHDDPATQQLLRWCRRQPASAGRKLPGAIRVSSYARSNAATRLYERCFTGTIAPDADAPVIPTLRDANATTYLQLADHTLARMEQLDAGFVLTLTGRLIAHAVHATLTGDDTDALAFFENLGEAKALDRLESLIKFDNHDELVAATRRLAERALPGLKRRLLVTRTF